jgi:hypothetical protein
MQTAWGAQCSGVGYRKGEKTIRNYEEFLKKAFCNRSLPSRIGYLRKRKAKEELACTDCLNFMKRKSSKKGKKNANRDLLSWNEESKGRNPLIRFNTTKEELNMTDDVGLVLKCDENGDHFSCLTNGCIKCMVQTMIGIRKDFALLSSKKSSKERLILLACFMKKIIGTSEIDSQVGTTR